MTTWFRHADHRFPFIWESAPQPPARWHDAASAPATYAADTPDGAWAEFLRHEEITDVADLPGISRRMWALHVPDDVVDSAAVPRLARAALMGDLTSYPDCQAEAARLRAAGAGALLAASAALLTGDAGGEVVVGGLNDAPDQDGRVLVLFGGRWPQVHGWVAGDDARPTPRQLRQVRHLT